MSPLRFALLFIALAAAGARGGMIGISVLLNQPVSDAILADLGTRAEVLDVIPEINAVTIKARAEDLPAIQQLTYVKAANRDAEHYPMGDEDGLPVPDFADGANQWSLDAINVTDVNGGRMVGYDGTGVYVAVIDTGLSHNWRSEERRVGKECSCRGARSGD